MFYQKLMDQNLTENLKYGLQTEGQTEKSNPNFAHHPNNEIAKVDNTTSPSRPLHLTALSRHLGETMDIFNQLNFKTALNKPLRVRRTSASSWLGPVTAGRSAARRRAGYRRAAHSTGRSTP